MKLPVSLPAETETEDEAPRLPGLRSWRSVYVVVLVIFAAVVGFLAIMTAVYG